MRTIYLQCNAGASGDMIVGALAGLLDDPQEFVSMIDSAGIPGLTLTLEKGEMSETRDAGRADGKRTEDDTPSGNGKGGSEKPRKERSQENGGKQNRQGEESAENPEKKKPRKKKNRPDPSASSAGQGPERGQQKGGSDKPRTEKGSAAQASENGEKAPSRKRRRHRPRRGAGDSQAAEAPKHTSEMKIYADRGSQSD